MSFKLLIVDTYYQSFLDSVYASDPDLSKRLYSQQWRSLMDKCFGTADFYSSNLRKLGHEAEEIIANCEKLQRQWGQEHGLSLEREWPMPSFSYKRKLPFPALRHSNRWLYKVLLAQVKEFGPDILYVQNVGWLPQGVLRQAKEHARLVVGQHATTLSQLESYRDYDLILSSLPNVVGYFRQAGVKSELLLSGFEPKVLERLGREGMVHQVIHVGGYESIHKERNEFLEEVAQQVEVDFWGYGIENLPPGSQIRRRYRGQAWGFEMYNIRHSSYVTLNKHITSVAGCYANNMTLYEATGVGTCLVTDMKENLHELFELDAEVVAYTSPEDCVEKVRYLLDHEDERAAIARAGQERTLREHTYYHRMQELMEILKNHLRHPERATRFPSRGGN